MTKDRLKKLLDLNLAEAKVIATGDEATAPGVPKGWKEDGYRGVHPAYG